MAHDGDEAERLLTTREVAALFRVDPMTVTRWAGRGRVPTIRTPGGRPRFRWTAVVRLLDELSPSAPPTAPAGVTHHGRRRPHGPPARGVVGLVDELRAALVADGAVSAPVVDLAVDVETWRRAARAAGRSLQVPIRTREAPAGWVRAWVVDLPHPGWGPSHRGVERTTGIEPA